MFCEFFSDNIVVKLLFYTSRFVLCVGQWQNHRVALSLYISLFSFSLGWLTQASRAWCTLYFQKPGLQWKKQVCSSDRNLLEHFFLRAQTLAAHLTCSQSSRFQNLSLDLQFRTGYTAQLLSRPNIEHAWVVGLELPSPPPPPPLPPVSQETVLTGGKSSSSRVNRPVFGWTSAPPPRWEPCDWAQLSLRREAAEVKISTLEELDCGRQLPGLSWLNVETVSSEVRLMTGHFCFSFTNRKLSYPRTENPRGTDYCWLLQKNYTYSDAEGLWLGSLFYFF